MKYPVYHAHKSSNQLKAKRLARFLAKPVAFTFLGGRTAGSIGCKNADRDDGCAACVIAAASA